MRPVTPEQPVDGDEKDELEVCGGEGGPHVAGVEALRARAPEQARATHVGGERGRA